MGFPNQDRLLQSKTLFKGKRERERRGEKTSLLENTGAAVCALGFFFSLLLPSPPHKAAITGPDHNKLMGWEREV